MAAKIARCNLINRDGAMIPTPGDDRESPTPIIVAPDKDGVLWYWDADPNPAPVAPT